MSRTGYTPIAQSIEEANEESDVGDFAPGPSTTHTRGRSHTIRPGSIDIKKLDNAFKRWTESIAQKVKRKKKAGPHHERRRIWHSVFEPQVLTAGVPSVNVKTLDHKPPMTQATYDAVVKSVKGAISEGIHPKMITKGSSGSYFARAKVEGRVQTVAYNYSVFKPKDEEPYGRLNPKAFFYDWIDRNAYKKGKPLPEKIGNASDFLRKYPWPGRAIADTFDDSSHRHGGFTKRVLNTLKIVCGRTGDMEDVYDESDYDDEQVMYDASESNNSERPFYWSQILQKSFREELEKLVILDYLMLNTDRGADNYMIKYCEGVHEKALVDVAPSRAVRKEMPVMSELRREASSSAPSMTTSSPYFASPVPSDISLPPSDYTRTPHIHIAAIDNSLSFPHEHPQGWRSYTYGWLYLPVSLIGRPFSEKTRNHFLPLLTSKEWWEETTFQLEKLFAIDPDFHPKMFRDEGPLELTRRKKALVWDDELEISEEIVESQVSNGPAPPSPKPSVTSVPPPRRARSQSSGGEFPPPIRRMSTDASGFPRPVSFATKFQRVHPGTTGVTVLEHLERLDAVEASLQRLGVEETQEVDVGVVATARSAPIPNTASASTSNLPTSPFSPPGSPLPTVPEVSSCASSIAEEDLAAMSKSMSYVESSPSHNGHRENARGLEWIQELPRKRMVIAERMEIVDKKPLCSCW
ncbi:hypothetical protein H0H92_009557 [Tricholoma furcatifolium]|nr:hypothetical protein H0H92_009557 [Tricholoma furcatifolium]